MYDDNSIINMPNLRCLLESLKSSNKCGNFTCNGSSIAVISESNVFGIFDSHSRGSNGLVESSNGTACFFASTDVNDISRVVKRNVPKSSDPVTNGQYQFTVLSIESTNIDIEIVPKKNIVDERSMIEGIEDMTVSENCEDNASQDIQFGNFEDVSMENNNLVPQYAELSEINVAEGLDNTDNHDLLLSSNNNKEIGCNPFSNSKEPVNEEVIITGQYSQEIQSSNFKDVSMINDDSESENDEVRQINEDEEIDNTPLNITTEPLNEGVTYLEDNGENIISNFIWIWKELHKAFDDHSTLFSCNFVNLKLIKMISIGLQKKLIFKCDMCGREEKVSSVRDTKNDVNLNISAVLGCQTIGIGLSQFQELLDACGVASMSYGSWQKKHGETTHYIEKAAEIEMKKAAAEEAQLAIERYDSPGYCMVIIGCFSQKVLQIVTKQKTCAICDNALSIGTDAPEHECYRNHGRNKSSTSMESIAIAEAFSKSVRDRGLIYRILVSDGDSSNYQAIVHANPYGHHNVEVQNIRCVNHIKRNISNAIKLVSKKKGELGSLRKKIEDSAPKFIQAIEECVANIVQQSWTWEQKCSELRKNIRKVTYHIFGDHSNCAPNMYQCNSVPAIGEKNLILNLQTANVLTDLEQCLYRAYSNADSLLYNLTTNKAESFNALIAKTIGAKRINFAQKDSYSSRCHVAVLSCNTAETFSPVCTAMEKNVPKIGQKVQQTRASLNLARTLRNNDNNGPKEKKQKCSRQDKDYGLYAYQVDANETEITTRIAEHMQLLQEWQEDRIGIELRTRKQGQCSEWRSKRKWLITASVLGKICKKRLTTSCSSIVSQILYSSLTPSEAMKHGNAMEILAKDILRNAMGIDVQDCGLFLDEEILGLAASPDGLIDTDGVLEIKCPYTAKDLEPEDAIRDKKMNISQAFVIKDGIAEIKESHDYYYQIQGQLRVTNRHYCLFVIFTLKGLKIMRIARNEDFIRRCIGKAVIFYEDCLIPEIVDSRRNRQLPIRDPPYIIEAQELSTMDVIQSRNADLQNDGELVEGRATQEMLLQGKKLENSLLENETK